MTFKPIIDLIGFERCTGCFSCYNSCQYGAIEMKEGEDGFYYPRINDNCIHCGSCQKHCPVINPVKKFFETKFYAGWSTDETCRMASSSGGIFPELAKYVLESGGVVFGVAWTEELIPRHIKVSEIREVSKIMGSKYVQSYVGLSYKEAVEEAKKRMVLFSGTPCQIAALKTFMKNHSNVISVDLVCHGVPSTFIFKKYIDWLERENGKKVLNISFRDKKFGWEDYQVVIKFEDGSEIRRYHYLDPFFKGYLSNFYLRNSCYKCEFCRIPRLSDITLGDFWGAPEKLRDQKGVSLVIVNSIIGQKMLGTLLQLGRIKLVEVTLKTATKRNPRIITGEYKIPDKRGLIIRQARELAFEDIIKYFEHTPPNKRIYKIRKIIIKCLKCILSLRLCVREE